MLVALKFVTSFFTICFITIIVWIKVNFCSNWNQIQLFLSLLVQFLGEDNITWKRSSYNISLPFSPFFCLFTIIICLWTMFLNKHILVYFIFSRVIFSSYFSMRSTPQLSHSPFLGWFLFDSNTLNISDVIGWSMMYLR